MNTIDTKVNLGTIAHRQRVVIHVRYGLDPHNTSPVTSMHTHETIARPDLLSITGELCDLTKRRTSSNFVVAAGQIIDDVRTITTPAGTLTLDDVNRLADLWRTWHLNTMRAHCAHMDLSTTPADLPNYVSAADRATGRTDVPTWRLDNLVCPVSGYRYGRAWLAEAVPDAVIAELSALIDKARS